MADGAVAEGVEAVVLTEDDRAEAADHEVLVRGVGEGVPVVAGVAFDALMELRVRIVVHGEACLDGGEDERGVVEAVLTGEEELLFCGLGCELGACRDGAEVGHDAENALGLLRGIGGRIGSG